MGQIDSTKDINEHISFFVFFFVFSHVLCPLVKWRMSASWIVSEVFLNAHIVEVKDVSKVVMAFNHHYVLISNEL